MMTMRSSQARNGVLYSNCFITRRHSVFDRLGANVPAQKPVQARLGTAKGGSIMIAFFY